jgi:hypothetical protein
MISLSELTHPLPAQSLAATYAAAKTENYGKVRKIQEGIRSEIRTIRNKMERFGATLWNVSERNGTDSLQVTGY